MYAIKVQGYNHTSIVTTPDDIFKCVLGLTGDCVTASRIQQRAHEHTNYYDTFVERTKNHTKIQVACVPHTDTLSKLISLFE